MPRTGDFSPPRPISSSAVLLLLFLFLFFCLYVFVWMPRTRAFSPSLVASGYSVAATFCCPLYSLRGMRVPVDKYGFPKRVDFWPRKNLVERKFYRRETLASQATCCSQWRIFLSLAVAFCRRRRCCCCYQWWCSPIGSSQQHKQAVQSAASIPVSASLLLFRWPSSYTKTVLWGWLA